MASAQEPLAPVKSALSAVDAPATNGAPAYAQSALGASQRGAAPVPSYTAAAPVSSFAAGAGHPGASSGPAPAVHLPYIKDQKIEDLILWRDYKKTGAVVAVVSVAYYFLELSGIPVYRLVLNSVAGGALATLLWANLGSVVNRPGPPVPKFLTHGFTSTEIVSYAEKYTEPLNKYLGYVGRVLQGKDQTLSLQVAAAAGLSSIFFLFISPLTLAFVAFAVLFSVPKLYELNKERVDGQLGKAQSGISSAYKSIDESLLQKIPKAESVAKQAAASTAAPADVK